MAFAIVLCCNSRGLICRAVCVGTCLDAAHTSRRTSTKKLPGEHAELGCPIATWARSPQRFCACPACQSWAWANEEIVSWVERLPASTLQVWWGRLQGGSSLPNSHLRGPSLWHSAGDHATQAFQLRVIAKFHKGIFMLSEYCLPHESNYRSCHGGGEWKGVNFMGVVFA